MAFEKHYTAKQAAEAVLKKAQELLVKSGLAKAESMDKCGTFSKVHEKAKREGYSEASADKIAGKAKSMEKYESENSSKLGYKPSELGAKEKQPEKTDKDYVVKPDAPANACGPESAASHSHPEVQKSEQDRLRPEVAPGNNPKEQAEGNNELAGTTPTQVGQDGKNVPGGDEIRGHLKLAKFIGRMEHKRSLRKGM